MSSPSTLRPWSKSGKPRSHGEGSLLGTVPVPHFVGWFAATGLVSLAAGLFPAVAKLDKELFERASYLAILALVLLTVGVVWTEVRHFLQREPGAWRRQEHWLPLLLSLLVATVACASVEPIFRVLADETNLLSKSLSMYAQGLYSNPTDGLWVHGELRVIAAAKAHRPGLYPTLMTILHALRGYHFQHGFWVNAGLLAIFPWLLHRLGRELGGPRFAYLTVGVALSLPLLYVDARSTGFELLAVTSWTLFLWRVAVALLRPTPRDVTWLLLSGALAAYSRYELAVTVAAVLPLLLWLTWKRRGERFDLTACLVPPLLVPLLWLRLRSQNLSNVGDTKDPVGLQYLGDNVRGYAKYFLNLDSGNNPFATQEALLPLAVVGIGVALYLARRPSPRQLQLRPFYYVAIASWLSFTLVQLLYYFGNFTLPWISRIALLQLPTLALLGAAALWPLLRWAPWRRLLPLVAAGAFLWSLQIAAANRHGRTLNLLREYAEITRFLDRYHEETLGGGDMLVISDRPGLYLPRGYGAIAFSNLQNTLSLRRQELREGLYQEILAVQQVNPISATPFPETQLPNGVATEELFRMQLHGGKSVVVNRVLLDPRKVRAARRDEGLAAADGAAAPLAVGSPPGLNPSSPDSAAVQPMSSLPASTSSAAPFRAGFRGQRPPRSFGP